MENASRREHVVEAANRVFLRFGYRRTTMGDIAEEAGISRPALYLVFPSKEEIFSAVLARVLEAELDEIRAAVAKADTAAEKLTLALEVWCVRNYELTRSSPGAADLYEASFEFASAVANKSAAAFDAIVAEILEPLVNKQSRVALSARELAQLISSAILGLKATAKSPKQLRALLRGFIAVFLASLSR
jgi:AcrR family transcriptional regulator